MTKMLGLNIQIIGFWPLTLKYVSRVGKKMGSVGEINLGGMKYTPLGHPERKKKLGQKPEKRIIIVSVRDFDVYTFCPDVLTFNVIKKKKKKMARYHQKLGPIFSC